MSKNKNDQQLIFQRIGRVERSLSRRQAEAEKIAKLKAEIAAKSEPPWPRTVTGNLLDRLQQEIRARVGLGTLLSAKIGSGA